MGTTQAPSPRVQSGKFTDEDMTRARESMPRAFAILGLVGPNGPICPICGQSKKGKVKLHPNGWKCFTDQNHPPRTNGSLYCDSIELLREAGYSFRDAVNVLIDRPVGDRELAQRVRKAPDPSTLVGPEFRAVVDSEVYARIMLSEHVSLAKAQEFYGVWHISGHAVEEAGARYVLDAEALYEELKTEYGIERLVKAGLIVPKDLDHPEAGGFFLIGRNYPVIEPHVTPTGVVVGMQFRASHATAKRVKEYPAKKAAYDEALARWNANHESTEGFSVKAPRYEPKFLSLRGAGPDSLVGCGLYRVGRLGHPTQIYVVEGFKDMLAARTMGREAYAIPGVSGMPPEKVLAFFKQKRHVLRVTMDADAAGRGGAETLLRILAEHGISADQKQDIPEGMDVTDVLVARRASRGCNCTTCHAWRRAHPEPTI